MRTIAVRFFYSVIMALALSGCSPRSLAPTPLTVVITNTPPPTLPATMTQPPTPIVTLSPAPTPVDPCTLSETTPLENRLIAFAGKWKNSDGIFAVQGDGSQRTLLAPQGFAPAWSPDGSRIAFLVKTGNIREVHFTNPGGTEETRMAHLYELHLVNPDATGETVIPLGDVSPVPAGSSLALDWSPDSHKLVFAGETSDSSSIYVLNIEDKTLMNLGPPQNYIFGTLLARWSPDGQTIAFQASLDEAQDLFFRIALVGAEGKNLQIIDSETLAEMEPQWHPRQGTLLFLSRERGAAPQLFTMNPDGSDRRQLTHTEAEEKISPVWSPDGQKIAYIGYEMGSDSDSGSTKLDERLYVLDGDGTHQTALIEEEVNSLTLRPPQWSPDSRYLAFARGKTDKFDLYVVDTCTSKVQRIAQSVSDYSPSWKP